MSTPLSLARIADHFGGRVLPDTEQWINRIEIRSASSSRLYVVAQRRSDRSWGCSCPGWKSRRACRHLTAMFPALQKMVTPRPLG